jgi:UDP-galactose transporter B1
VRTHASADVGTPTGGISLFAAAKSSGAVLSKLAAPNAPVGYLLVFLNLWLDAFTNTYQDQVRVRLRPGEKGGACTPARAQPRLTPEARAAQIKDRFPKTSPQQLMCYMNLWCTLYYALYMFGYSSALALR